MVTGRHSTFNRQSEAPYPFTRPGARIALPPKAP